MQFEVFPKILKLLMHNHVFYHHWGRDGAPKLAYQSGYNFGFLIYVVQGAFAQFESKIGGGVIGPNENPRSFFHFSF